ncbi:hypothetical protein AVEN_234568-1 [Araneus ventricosus]|uniref:Uncharacterized protein n=1 Tax=Araneus ventricosus TaxID=182803 RepID=A0A4Y2AAP0_ARAVE|nr:hypothetical protein AVEN_234568-1 [Araneus ventricosus]
MKKLAKQLPSPKTQPHADTQDDDLDPEDLDNQECIICYELGKAELGFQCFMRKILAHFACTYRLGQNPRYTSPMSVRFL